MAYSDLSDEDVALITGALQEQMDRLDSELPDPSAATDEDHKKVHLAMRLGGLINKLNPKRCGLHDFSEPCPRCQTYTPLTQDLSKEEYCSCNNWAGSDYRCQIHGNKP